MSVNNRIEGPALTEIERAMLAHARDEFEKETVRVRKRWITISLILAALIVVCMPFMTAKYQFAWQKGDQYNDYITGYVLTNYSGYDSEVVLPQRYLGRQVMAIDAFAMKNNKYAQRVVIPEGVKSIELSAFSYCSNMREVQLPDSLVLIGERAFAGCTALESINIPDGVERIDSLAFTNCHSLRSVTIPKSVKHIGSYAFEDCENLTVTAPHESEYYNEYYDNGQDVALWKVTARA